MAGRRTGRSPPIEAWTVRLHAWGLATLTVAVSLLLAASVARADDLSAAGAAFDRGDFVRAQEIWRGLAVAGEPEAAFRLGLMYDLGLGQAADAVKAFRWYLEAAYQGHVAAQFNVGVMLDAGTGADSSPAAAATWYARSAAKGLARAQYNLGLLYAEGKGLPRNLGLARAWMSRATETLPAARARLTELRELEIDAAERPVAPSPLAAAAVRSGNDAAVLELVWTAEEQPPGTHYRVELEGASADLNAESLNSIEVSAVAVQLSGVGPRAWRVLAVDRAGDLSAASDWQRLAGTVGGSSLDGRVAIRFGSNDALARAFATELAGDFARSGFDVETAAIKDADFAKSEVRYFFEDDASLARSISAALPVLAGQAVFETDDARRPGTVEVRLRGGPALTILAPDG